MLVLVSVLAPPLTAVVLMPDLPTVSAAAATAGLVFYPLVFVSGVFLYLHWRLTCSPASYWLTVCLSLVAAHGLILTVSQMVSESGLAMRPVWLVGSDLVVGLMLLALVLAAEHVTLSLDPAATGILVGLSISVADVVATNLAGELLWQAPWFQITARVVLVMVGLCLLVAVIKITTLPRWAVGRLGLAGLTLSVHRILAHTPTPDTAFWDALALVTGLTGSVLLCGATLALLRAAIRDDRAAIRQLQDMLAVTENEARVDRDRLHQIRSAVAGISSATALIAGEAEKRAIPPAHLHLLHELVERETARLQRLTQDRRAPLEEVVELDEVLRPLAASQELLGLRVHWSPSGQRVRGSIDRIAEVIQTLLDNARDHADGAPVDIEVRRTGSEVEITVADTGPGVPADLEDAIFARGARRAGSSGEGIGLHVAHGLMDEGGSTLHLDRSRRGGAAFVLRMPAADRQGLEP